MAEALREIQLRRAGDEGGKQSLLRQSKGKPWGGRVKAIAKLTKDVEKLTKHWHANALRVYFQLTGLASPERMVGAPRFPLTPKACRKGHPRTPENTRAVGKRARCRECLNAASRRYKAKRRRAA
jgi:hypothetical protein